VAHAAASGAVTCHDPLLQRAVVRQFGRGSSPQLQSARGTLKPPSAAGKVQLDPEVGGAAGQLLAPDPPVPCAPPVELPPPPSVAKAVPPPHAAASSETASAKGERDEPSFGIEISSAPRGSRVETRASTS
jgi:hypothetical protein